MTASRDPDRLIRGFLEDGPNELPDRSYDAVRSHIDHTRQRVVLGPWRVPEMPRIVTIGLGLAAVVAFVLVGMQRLGSPAATPAQPTSSAETLEEYVLVDGTDGHRSITVSTGEPRWRQEPAGGALCWGDAPTCAGPPNGAAIYAFAGRRYQVYSDACHRPGPGQDTFATTVDELIDALRRQVHRHGSLTPNDIVLDGHAGKSIRLYSDPSPGDCDHADDRSMYSQFRIPGDDLPPYTQDSSRKDEVWAVDVDGMIVVLVAASYPGTPASVVEELRDIAESATFQGR